VRLAKSLNDREQELKAERVSQGDQGTRAQAARAPPSHSRRESEAAVKKIGHRIKHGIEIDQMHTVDRPSIRAERCDADVLVWIHAGARDGHNVHQGLHLKELKFCYFRCSPAPHCASFRGINGGVEKRSRCRGIAGALPECSDLVAPQRMDARLAVLDAANRKPIGRISLVTIPDR
jgi:hypothetical protein